MRKSEINAVTWNKRQLIEYMAKKNNVSIEQAKAAYQMTLDAIKEVVSEGYPLRLVGFGMFYLQLHRGNPVQFQNRKSMTPSDYLVFKFSASTTLNKSIRAQAAMTH